MDKPYDRPQYERPALDRPPHDRPIKRPISPGPDGPIYDNFGGIGPNRPYVSRCDEGGDNFKQIGFHQRMRKEFVKREMYAPSLRECERECVETRDFICRSFNYK